MPALALVAAVVALWLVYAAGGALVAWSGAHERRARVVTPLLEDAARPLAESQP